MLGLKPGIEATRCALRVKRRGATRVGFCDEFYCIMCGSGDLKVAGKRFALAPGDPVCASNKGAHGIEYVSGDGMRKVYVVSVLRD
jgi:mannose-6-phosphate isomerase-like protein (cupin superfamily)